MQIVSITTPNHLHADQAVAAARAGKHFVLEKPTAMNTRELKQIRKAVRKAKVRTIVSFELHYNPYLKFVHWLRESGRLGRIRFVRVPVPLARDRLVRGLGVGAQEEERAAATCWPRAATPRTPCAGCSGLEPVEVSAYHTRFTKGYEWPTTIEANIKMEGKALGHLTSSTDFMLPYTFGVELMGDKATAARHPHHLGPATAGRGPGRAAAGQPRSRRSRCAKAATAAAARPSASNARSCPTART